MCDLAPELPPGLARLIANGVWPSAAGPSLNAQQLRPLVPAERVRRLAAEESCICLYAPPFGTVARARGAHEGDFWEQFGALDQIDPERAVIVADFGLGSDAVVVLDFARDASNPPLLRLRWGPRGQGNEWVRCADDFDEFAAVLGLNGLNPLDR